MGPGATRDALGRLVTPGGICALKRTSVWSSLAYLPGGVGDNASPVNRPRQSMNPASLALHPALVCAILLSCSNLFMTFAWYGT